MPTSPTAQKSRLPDVKKVIELLKEGNGKLPEIRAGGRLGRGAEYRYADLAYKIAASIRAEESVEVGIKTSLLLQPASVPSIAGGVMVAGSHGAARRRGESFLAKIEKLGVPFIAVSVKSGVVYARFTECE